MMSGTKEFPSTDSIQAVIAGLAEEYDYVCYIDMAKEEITRYRANAVFLQQMEGIDRSKPSFEQMLELFKRVVHPDEWRRFEKMVCFFEVEKVLQTMPMFKYLFRAIIDGGETFYSINFICDKNNPHGMIMGLLNIDAKARSELKRIEAEAMLRNADYIKTLGDEFAIFCDIDVFSGSYETIVCNEEYEKTIQSRVTDESNFFTAVKNNAEKLIWKEDLDWLLQKMNSKYLARALRKKNVVEFDFRFIVGEEPVWHHAKAMYKNEKKERFIIGISNIDAKKKSEEERLRELKLIEMLAGSYLGVYYVNLEDGSYSDFQSNEDLKAEYSELTDFRDCIKKFIKERVVPVDQRRLAAISEFDYIKKQLKRSRRFSVVFRDVMAGYPRFCEAQVIRVDPPRGKEIKYFLLTLEDRDEELRRRREQEAIIKTMINDYQGIWYINLYADRLLDRVSVFRQSEILEKAIPDWKKSTLLANCLRGLCVNFVHADDQESFRKKTSRDTIFEKLRKSEYYVVNFRGVYNEQIHYYQLKFIRLTKNSQDRAMLVGFRNNDVEMELEAEREQRQRDLTEALAMAKEANAAKTTFLFNMSHDIRTPMNAIVGFTRMARKNIDNQEKLTDCLDKVELSSKLLLQLINDVLDMARVESGKVYIEESVTDICSIADNLMAMMKDSAAAKKIVLAHDYKSLTDTMIYADALHLNQVLINLLSNAIKYTKERGTVAFGIEQLPLEQGGYVAYRFIVADTGIGMSKEFLDHIFEHFSRERTATVSGIQGTGLGMSIVQRLVDLMGGTIDIKSEQGKGTTITVDLKFRSAKGMRLISDSMEEIEQEKRLDGLKVLLVEDNELNREIASELLRESGAEVFEAEDGAEAVDKVRAARAGKYDVILMDIQMPYMDGYLATMTIRSMHGHPLCNVPIIAMTANVFDEDRKKAQASGMNAHLAKPIDVKEMVKTIRQVLSKN